MNPSELKELIGSAGDFWAFRHKLIEIHPEEKINRKTDFLIALPKRKLLPGQTIQDIQNDIQRKEKVLARYSTFAERVERLIELIAFYIRSSKFNAASGLVKEGLKGCGKKHIQAKSEFLLAQGIIEYISGTIDKSLALLLKAEKIKTTLQDKKGLVTTWNNIGVIYSKRGEWEQALEYYRKSEKIMNEENHLDLLAIIYNNTGAIYAKRGEWKQAKIYYHESEKIMNEENRLELLAVFNNIGVMYANRGEWEQALEYYRKSEKIMFELSLTGSSLRLPSKPVLVGREKDLDELLHRIKNKKTICLTGRGGVGKTALGTVLTYEIAKDFPHGQLYITMGGSSVSPLDIKEALSLIISHLLPQTKLPEKEDQLEKLYKNILQKRHVVVLLDDIDIKQFEKIKPFIAQPGCLFILTSRLEINLSEVYPVEPLKSESAERLLKEIVPRIARKAKKIAALCGNLPLDLVSAGKYLKECKNVKEEEEYIKELAENKKDGNAATTFSIFSIAFRSFNEEEQLLWLNVTVFFHSFDLEAVAAVWQIGEERAKNRLEKFISLNFIERDETNNLYYLHDLAAYEFAKKIVYTDKEKKLYKAAKRHAQHYKNILERANQQYLKGGSSFYEGIMLLDRDFKNIQAGQKWADTYKMTDKIADRLCIEYPAAGFDILNLRQRIDEHIFWIESGIESARRLNDRKMEGILLGLKGLSVRYRGDAGDTHHSIKLLEEAVEIADSFDKRWKGIHLNDLGNAYALLGFFISSNDYHKKALEIFKIYNDDIGQGIVLNNMARAFINLGKPQEAIELDKEALSIAKRIGDFRREGGALSNMGAAYRHLGDLKKAEECQKKALGIFKKAGDRVWEGISLCLLGRILMDKDEKAIKDGERRTEEALKIFKEFGNRRWEGIAYGNLGVAYKNQERREDAIDHLKKAIRIADEIGDLRRKAIHLNLLGEVYLNAEKIDSALWYIDEALKHARHVNDKRRQAGALLHLGNAYRHKDDRKKAGEYLEQSFQMAREVGDKKKMGTAKWFEALLKKTEGKDKDALNLAGEAYNIFEEIEASNSREVEEKIAEWS